MALAPTLVFCTFNRVFLPPSRAETYAPSLAPAASWALASPSMSGTSTPTSEDENESCMDTLVPYAFRLPLRHLPSCVIVDFSVDSTGVETIDRCQLIVCARFTVRSSLAFDILISR